MKNFRFIIFILFFYGCTNTINKNLEYINSMNKEIMIKSESIYDINNIEISIDEIKNNILSYNVFYGGVISDGDINDILINRNINNISGLIKKGIVTKRSYLKGIPTNLKFFQDENDIIFDKNLESELHVNMPILVLHESLDSEWYYIRTYFYEGWVLKDDIVIVNDEDFAYFLNPIDFIIITDSHYLLNNLFLDMSVKIPLVQDKDNYIGVVASNMNGVLSKKEVIIPKDKAHIGYLDYTKENVIEQAKKYLDTEYGWGGMNNKVDCSSFVANVFRTFSFMFPRNTSSQRMSIGEITNTEETKEEKIREILKNTSSPTLIYTDSHVLLYLYTEDDKQFVIHASGESLKVQIDSLKNVNGSNLYEKIISINEVVLKK